MITQPAATGYLRLTASGAAVSATATSAAVDGCGSGGRLCGRFLRTPVTRPSCSTAYPMILRTPSMSMVAGAKVLFLGISARTVLARRITSTIAAIVAATARTASAASDHPDSGRGGSDWLRKATTPRARSRGRKADSPVLVAAI